MSFFSTIKSEAARALRDLQVGLAASESFVAKIVAAKPTQAVVEALTTAVAGPGAAAVESAVFNVAGEISTLLTSVNHVTNESALVNLGFDQTILTEFKAVVASVKKV